MWVQVISDKIGKILQNIKGESAWNLITQLYRRNLLKWSMNYYKVNRYNKSLKDKVEYNKIVKNIPLSEIIKVFGKKNIIENGINNVIDCKNILIDEINWKKYQINKWMKLWILMIKKLKNIIILYAMNFLINTIMEN